MTTGFRHFLIAAGLLGAAAAAQAAVVTKTLNFDDLGATDAAGKGGAVIGDHYKKDFGVTFDAGGRVYNTSPPKAINGSLGYLSNVDDGKFSINVDTGVDYDLLTIDFAVAADPFSLQVTDRGGKTASFTLVGTGGGWDWIGDRVLDLKDIGNISTIEFQATRAGSFFAVDNIAFGRTTAGGGGGGNVPEPAGYGLVAMALLAAGWSSRRRAR